MTSKRRCQEEVFTPQTGMETNKAEGNDVELKNNGELLNN